MRLKSLMSSGQIRYRIHQIILDMQAADERMLSRIEFETISTQEMRALSATLLTHDSQYVRTIDESESQAALVPDWGSWIEGQPLTTAILSNRALLVDLDAVGPAEFAQKYRCTVGQFIAIIKWFQKHGKRIHINLREVDPDDAASFDKYGAEIDSIGLILQEIDDNSIFYVLGARRNIVFSLTEGNRPHDRLRLKRFYADEMARMAEHHGALKAAYDALPLDSAEDDEAQVVIRAAEVRGGQLIGERQMAWRLAYYRAYRDIFSDFSQSRIDTLLSLGAPTVAELAELARLVTLFHHRYTAPITGAFGGTYNLRLQEYGPMATDIVGGEPGDHIHGLRSHKAFTDAESQIWEWIATENVRKTGRVVENNVSTMWSMVQRQQTVNDETVDYILNQAKPITDDIQAYRDDLITSLRTSILSQTKGSGGGFGGAEYLDALNSKDAGALLGEMERAVAKVNCVGGVVASKILMGFGLGFAVPTAGPLVGAAVFGISWEGIGKLFDEALKDDTRSGIASAISQRLGRTTARMQIVSVLDDISRIQPARR